MLVPLAVGELVAMIAKNDRFCHVGIMGELVVHEHEDHNHGAPEDHDAHEHDPHGEEAHSHTVENAVPATTAHEGPTVDQLDFFDVEGRPLVAEPGERPGTPSRFLVDDTAKGEPALVQERFARVLQATRAYLAEHPDFGHDGDHSHTATAHTEFTIPEVQETLAATMTSFARAMELSGEGDLRHRASQLHNLVHAVFG